MPFHLDHVDTVILAGGINRIPLYEGYTPDYKALIEFREKPSICYVLDALRAAPCTGRICIAGPEASLRQKIAAHDKASYDFVPSGETLMDSIYSGLSHFADSPMVLLVTADIPLITPRAITDFLIASAAVETSYEHNLLLAVTPERSFTGAYAHIPKGFNRFRDVAICHGSLMLADPRLLQNTKATRRINSLYRNRKNPISSALAIGLHVGLTYVLGVHLWHLLTLEQMASIASRRFGLGLLPIVLDHPEVTIDVDEPEDYAFAAAQLGMQTTPVLQEASS